MKLFVDDLRDPPHESWVTVRTSRQALNILVRLYGEHVGMYEITNYRGLEVVSLDHDLGGDDTTRPVMEWMIENNFWPERLIVHSANRVGRDHLLTLAHIYGPDEMYMPQRWMVAGR